MERWSRRAEVCFRGQIMLSHVKTFLRGDEGATAIEYALISALIAIALISVLTNLGTQLSAEFSEVSSSLK